MSALLLTLAALVGPQSCDGSQSQMNACAARFYQQADEALNTQWAKTLAALRRNDRELSKWPSYDGPSADSLMKAQRAWITYRQKNCEAVQRISGGTIASFRYFVCMFNMTNARTDELRRLALNPSNGEPL